MRAHAPQATLKACLTTAQASSISSLFDAFQECLSSPTSHTQTHTNINTTTLQSSLPPSTIHPPLTNSRLLHDIIPVSFPSTPIFRHLKERNPVNDQKLQLLPSSLLAPLPPPLRPFLLTFIPAFPLGKQSPSTILRQLTRLWAVFSTFFQE